MEDIVKYMLDADVENDTGEESNAGSDWEGDLEY